MSDSPTDSPDYPLVWLVFSVIRFLPISRSIFIDAINGNIFNSLLEITIEIQMKEEYVVIVRYPNRYYTG